jgi:hypothetical protein
MHTTTAVCAPVGHVVYFNLTVPAGVGATCTVDLIGSSAGFDSVIAVYSACSATTAVACDDDGAEASGRGLSSLSFVATGNFQIIGVGSYEGAFAGQFKLNIDCPATRSPTVPTASPTARPTRVPSKSG